MILQPKNRIKILGIIFVIAISTSVVTKIINENQRGVWEGIGNNMTHIISIEKRVTKIEENK
jgi:hypothetical protein